MEIGIDRRRASYWESISIRCSPCRAQLEINWSIQFIYSIGTRPTGGEHRIEINSIRYLRPVGFVCCLFDSIHRKSNYEHVSTQLRTSMDGRGKCPTPRGGKVRGGNCPGGKKSGGGKVRGGKCPFPPFIHSRLQQAQVKYLRFQMFIRDLLQLLTIFAQHNA